MTRHADDVLYGLPLAGKPHNSGDKGGHFYGLRDTPKRAGSS